MKTFTVSVGENYEFSDDTKNCHLKRQMRNTKMIEYILISYVVMLFWCGKHWLCEDETLKACFKNFLVSPLSMPWYFIVAFFEW